MNNRFSKVGLLEYLESISIHCGNDTDLFMGYSSLVVTGI